MVKMIPPEIVSKVKRAITFKEYIDRFIEEIPRDNKINCVFCGSTKTPAFHVYRDGYKCYSCQRHGDIFDFIGEYYQLNFVNAVLQLAGLLGIVIDDNKDFKPSAPYYVEVGYKLEYDPGFNCIREVPRYKKLYDPKKVIEELDRIDIEYYYKELEESLHFFADHDMMEEFYDCFKMLFKFNLIRINPELARGKPTKLSQLVETFKVCKKPRIA